jgi:hypothetical protein
MPTPDEPKFPAPVKGELPVKGTRLYRGSQGGEVKDAGIHWTLDKKVADAYSRRGGGEGYVMETEVDDPAGQVIPRQALEFRSGFDKDFMSNQDRLNYEQEYHLRPGANVRLLNRDQLGKHFPEQVKIQPTGKRVAYTNLSSFATTPLEGAKIQQKYADRFGETQGALFAEVIDKEDKTVRYIPEYRLDFEGHMSEFLDNYQDGDTTRSMEVRTPPKTEDK